MALVPENLVANDIPDVVVAGGAVASYVFQTPVVNSHYTIADQQTAVALNQLIDHDARALPSKVRRGR